MELSPLLQGGTEQINGFYAEANINNQTNTNVALNGEMLFVANNSVLNNPEQEKIIDFFHNLRLSS